MAQITKEQIIAALAKLDPKNDAHWTGAGEPKMEEIESILESKEVTRAQVKAAAPDFSRESAQAPGTTPNAGEGGASQGSQAQDTSDADLSERKRIAQDELNEARKSLDEARKAYDAANINLDAIISEEQQETGKVSQADMVKRYQKAQAGLAKDDAEKMKALGKLLKKG